MYDAATSREKVGTRAFADAVIERLGQTPRHLPAVSYSDPAPVAAAAADDGVKAKPVKALVGVDVFLDWDEPGREPAALAERLQGAAADSGLGLKMITNRGVKVWPDGFPETFCTEPTGAAALRPAPSSAPPTPRSPHAQVLGLLTRLADRGLDFIKTEHLCTFDGEVGYSRGQGE